MLSCSKDVCNKLKLAVAINKLYFSKIRRLAEKFRQCKLLYTHLYIFTYFLSVSFIRIESKIAYTLAP